MEVETEIKMEIEQWQRRGTSVKPELGFASSCRSLPSNFRFKDINVQRPGLAGHVTSFGIALLMRAML